MNQVHLEERLQLCFIPVGACPPGREGGLGGKGPAQRRSACGTTSCWEFPGAFCGMPGLAVHLGLGPSCSRKEACARPSSGLAAAPPLQGLPRGAVPLPHESGRSHHAHDHEQPGPCRGPGKGRGTGPGARGGNGAGETREMLSSFLFRSNDRLEGSCRDSAERASSPSPGRPLQLHLQ